MKKKEKKDSIRIRSSLHREIETEVVIGGEKYLILTGQRIFRQRRL